MNFYMFFGGTNFGFTAGANDFGESKYTPDITSYDYDAVMDEMGNITKKFELVRNVIREYRDIPDIELDKEESFAYGRVEMKSVLNMLSSEGRATLAHGETLQSVKPMTFEELDQFSGLVLYETDISHINDNGTYELTLNDLRDRALVYVDLQRKGILSRQNSNFTLTLENLKGSKLQLLVENQGRINFNVANDTKGILGTVTLQMVGSEKIYLENWLNTQFPLEEPHITKLWSSIQNNSLTMNVDILNQGPIVYYGEFLVSQIYHTFLNPLGWGKGVAFVNGFNVGRYWPVAGPQVTLYVPQEILHKGRNALVMIEYEQSNSGTSDGNAYITLDDKPQLDG